MGTAEGENLAELRPVVDVGKLQVLDRGAGQDHAIERPAPDRLVKYDVLPLDVRGVAARITVRLEADPDGIDRKQRAAERPEEIGLVGLRPRHDVDDSDPQRSAGPGLGELSVSGLRSLEHHVGRPDPASRLGESLLDVGQDVVDVLEANGQADEVRRNPRS